MKIVITEEQYKKILIESTLKDTLNDLKINSGILFTFGTGMAAFLPVVNRLLEGDGLSMTKTDLAFLIITSVAILLKDNDSEKLVDAVEQKGQLDVLDKVITFMDKLFSFLRNMAEKFLNVSYSVSDILAFSLLLNPSMKVMTEFIEEHNVSMSNFTKLFTGVGLATIVYGFKSIFKRLKNKITEDVKPSSSTIQTICDSEKFCSAQGKITFGQLKALVDSATNKRLFKHVGEGGFKATLRLLPWFIPQLAVAGFVTSSVRAINKILKPALTETESYKTWWAKAVLKVFDLTEGELNLDDPLSQVFFMTDGLMNMLSDRYKIQFARHVAEVASSMPDDEEVPDFFVENELRSWLNERFLLDPPLEIKTKKPSQVARLSKEEE